MTSKYFLDEPESQTYIPVMFPLKKKVDWVTPAIKVFKDEWKKTEYAKKYGVRVNRSS